MKVNFKAFIEAVGEFEIEVPDGLNQKEIEEYVFRNDYTAKLIRTTDANESIWSDEDIIEVNGVSTI